MFDQTNAIEKLQTLLSSELQSLLVVCTKLLLMMTDVDSNRQLLRKAGTIGQLLDHLALGDLDLSKNVLALVSKCWCTRMSLSLSLPLSSCPEQLADLGKGLR